MECNRNDALNAKLLAEKKLQEKDFDGAMKFALKARALYPSLEGISQMILVLDVYVASKVKLNGQTDFYKILSADPSASEEMLKKQYRKLALQLHPDKNKALDAEGAFKLISEAWSVLSDKLQRMAYDQKRNAREFQPMTHQPKQDPSGFHSSANNVAASADYQKNASGAASSFFSSSSKRKLDGFRNSTNNVAASAGYQKKASDAAPLAVGSSASSWSRRSATFWAMCHRCLVYYEFSREYRNHRLPCAKCKEPFLASETGGGPPNNNDPSVPKPVPPPKQHQEPFSSAAGAERTAASSTAAATAAAKAPNMVKKANAKARRQRDDSQASVKREESLKRKRLSSKRETGSSGANIAGLSCNSFDQKRSSVTDAGRPLKEKNTGDAAGDDHGVKETDKIVKGPASKTFSPSMGVSQAQKKVKHVPGGSSKTRFTFDKSYSKEDMQYLKEKAKVSIYNKLQEPKLESAEGSFVVKKDKRQKLEGNGDEVDKNAIDPNKEGPKENVGERGNDALDIDEFGLKKMKIEENHKEKLNDSVRCDGDAVNLKKQKLAEKHKERPRDSVHAAAIGQEILDNGGKSEKKLPPMKNPADDSGYVSDDADEGPVSMDVPDPDFYDFDQDRAESSVRCDEVWAIYDNEDGMPRYYVLVQKIISVRPFKVRISYLRSKSTAEFGPLEWVEQGFSKTAGEFRVGRYQIHETINTFSHKMKWKSGPHGIIMIFPRKHSVWALYRNWSPDWDASTKDEVVQKYDMVEVVDEYDMEQGISVAPLVKVPGFKTVFCRHADKVRRIPRVEMFRFSHEVPSHVLTGEEGNNAPEGCFELDPAATPIELLQIITETEEDEETNTAGN